MELKMSEQGNKVREFIVDNFLFGNDDGYLRNLGEACEQKSPEDVLGGGKGF